MEYHNNGNSKIIPTSDYIRSLTYQLTGKTAVKITRFTTGFTHYVYEVTTSNQDIIVVRLCRPELKSIFKRALYWYPILQKKGVPLPELYSSSLETPFPIMILDRLPGKDLGLIYKNLSFKTKKRLADEIHSIHTLVQTLPGATGFGYATSSEDPHLLNSWGEVLRANMQRSRKRIANIGEVPPEYFDLVRQVMDAHEHYLSKVEPIPFLDDTTTKNVIIHKNSISGIVDVDFIAYGDPLYAVALTRASLKFKGYDNTFTDYWTSLLKINTDQQKALHLYTSLFYLDFWSEKGQSFNKIAPIDIKENQLNRVKSLIREELSLFNN
ncbi:hypothetical protein BH23BAC1_BH23BAC1_26030 [soil metagenome]